MNRAPFREVLEGTLALGGQVVDSTATALLGVVQNFINVRYAEALYWGQWPELTLDEERAFADDWSASRAWVAGEYCYVPATGKYYKALLAGTNKAPATETTYWQAGGPGTLLVATAQWGKNKLGRVFEVAEGGRWAVEGGRNYEFVQTSTGIVVGGEHGLTLTDTDATASLTTCWVRYIPQAEVWSTKVWDGTKTDYVRGDVVMSSLTEDSKTFPQRGECYRAEVDVDGVNFWMLQQFPRILLGFVSAAAGADLLRYYGKPEEGERLEAMAYGKLMNASRMAGMPVARMNVRLP